MMFRILMCVMLFAVTCSGQTSGSGKVYTLDDCLKIASDNNLDIQSGAAQYQAQAAYVTQAFGAFLPTMGASMGYSRQLNVEGGRTVNIGGQVIPIAGAEPNSYSMSAYASYNIFNGFAREANYNRTKQELSATDFNFRRIRQTVGYTVRSQYISVLRAMQINKIRKENIELGKKEVERMQALFDAGRVPIGNVLSQQADLGSRELDEVNSDNQVNQAKAQILTTLAVQPDQRSEFMESAIPSTVDDNTLTEFRREIGSYNAAVKKALESRPDFQAFTARIEAASSSVTAAHSGRMPDLNASGGWSWSNSQFNNFGNNGRYYISMNLSVPIFDNFNTSTQIQTANVALRQREIESQQSEMKIRSEVQSAFLNLEAAEKQLEITSRALKSAEQNFKSAQERLNVGAATVLDYLTANNLLINAKINRVNAVYNYFDVQFQVRYAIGTLKEG